MFQDPQFLGFIEQVIQVSHQFGVTDSSGFQNEITKIIEKTPPSEPRCYTQAFFLAYREKFALGYSQTTGTPPTQTAPKTYKPTRSAPFGSTGVKHHSSPNISVVPVVKVERSATGFVPSREKADDNPKIILVKKIKSELNKLAAENYDIIVPRVIDIIVSGNDSSNSSDVIPEFIEIMFGKVQVDIKYLGLYSKMCTEFNAKFLTFKHQLLTQCQLEFNSAYPVKPELEGDPKSEENEAEMEEYQYEVSKWKAKRLTNVKFIAELRKVTIISDNVISMILQDLLKHSTLEPISDNISHACELMTMVHTIVDQTIIQLYVKRLDLFTGAGTLSTLETVKIQNFMDLNKKNIEDKTRKFVHTHSVNSGSTVNNARSGDNKQEPFRRRFRK